MDGLSSSLHRMSLGGNQPASTLPHVYFTLTDISYCGLRGINESRVLYRVCRDDEDIDNDIVSKAGPSPAPITPQTKFIEAKKAVNLHIHSGHIPTQFISCTASRDVALKWAFYDKKQLRPIPQRIIRIYTSRIPAETANQMINLTEEEVRLSGKPQKDFAKGGQEVLFQWRIPKEVSTEKTDGFVQENLFDLWVTNATTT